MTSEPSDVNSMQAISCTCTTLLINQASAKFHDPWSGPHRITAKISDLNNEIQDNDKKQIVHLYRLKAAHVFTNWKPKQRRACTRYPRIKLTKSLDNEEDEVRIGPFPLVKEIPLESGDPPNQTSNTPEHTPQVMDTPTSERADPTYYPPNHPIADANYRPPEQNP